MSELALGGVPLHILRNFDKCAAIIAKSLDERGIAFTKLLKTPEALQFNATIGVHDVEFVVRSGAHVYICLVNKGGSSYLTGCSLPNEYLGATIDALKISTVIEQNGFKYNRVASGSVYYLNRKKMLQLRVDGCYITVLARNANGSYEGVRDYTCADLLQPDSWSKILQTPTDTSSKPKSGKKHKKPTYITHEVPEYTECAASSDTCGTVETKQWNLPYKAQRITYLGVAAIDDRGYLTNEVTPADDPWFIVRVMVPSQTNSGWVLNHYRIVVQLADPMPAYSLRSQHFSNTKSNREGIATLGIEVLTKQDATNIRKVVMEAIRSK